MNDVFIKHFRLSIRSSRYHAVHYSERTSRLFHRELKTILRRVFSGKIPSGLSIRLESPLVLKLGDIPEAFFERTFCQRLENSLEQALRRLLAEQGDLWISDPPAQCRELLAQALRSGDEPADGWLARQLALAPDIWLPVLAEYVLLPEGAELYHRLHEDTVRELCRQLAPDVPQQGGVTGDSLWLGALHYLQQLQSPSIPPPPVTTVPGVPPELRVVAAGGQATSYDVRLLQALFDNPVSPPAPLTPWLRALWQNPGVVKIVRPALSSERVTQWHRLLTGNSLFPQKMQQMEQTQQVQCTQQGLCTQNHGTRQVKPSRPGNRKSDSLSEALWHPASCAGMVLLWPMLPGLFRHLGLLEERQFVSLQAPRQATGCLLWLALRQNAPPPEQRVSRLLCGLPAEGGITSEDMPDDITRERLRNWLTDLPGLLPSTWKKLSAEDIRQWFLLRPGWISPEPGQALLRLQPEVFDVLLNDWTWPVNVVSLPWLEAPMTVRWTDK